MNDKELDKLFQSLEGSFDVHEPPKGHQDRFLAKLKDADTDTTKSTPVLTLLWKPLLAAAAALVIFLGVYGGANSTLSEDNDLASVSPELAKTQDFFTATINEELKKLNAERSPITENIIHHAMRQLSQLERDYEALKTDLNESGNDKRVIYAMISNFQNRINLLNEVLDQIDDLKQLKTNTNDNENTL